MREIARSCVMRLRVFYTGSNSSSHEGVTAAPLDIINRHLLQLIDDGSHKKGQARFTILIIPKSHRSHVQQVLAVRKYINFTCGQIRVDDFHNTQSDVASMPSVIREINDDACIQLYCLHRQKKAESDKRCHFQTQGALPGLFATRVHYKGLDETVRGYDSYNAISICRGTVTAITATTISAP